LEPPIKKRGPAKCKKEKTQMSPKGWGDAVLGRRSWVRGKKRIIKKKKAGTQITKITSPEKSMQEDILKVDSKKQLRNFL